MPFTPTLFVQRWLKASLIRSANAHYMHCWPSHFLRPWEPDVKGQKRSRNMFVPVNTVRMKALLELCVLSSFCDSWPWWTFLLHVIRNKVQFMPLPGIRHPLPAFLCLTWMLLLTKINSICLLCNCCLTVIQSVQSFRFISIGHTISAPLPMISFSGDVI